MDNSTISIIVPIYNADKYLYRCINSILAQTYKNFELLLIDDGSTDKSGDICDEFAKKDVRVRVFHKENGGVSSARNIGIYNACGEWITFVDADDWIENECLEFFIKNMSDLTCISFQSFYKGKKELWDTYIYNAKSVVDYTKELHNKEILGYCWGKLFKAEIIQKNNIKFNEHIRFREDELFVLEYLAYISQITYINNKCYNYNRPNWSKYDNYYDYETRLLLYKGYKSLFPSSNSITDKYLLDLVGYIINQYNINIVNYKTFNEVQKISKHDIGRLKQVSFLTKFLWKNLPMVAHIYLKLKSKILYKIKI